MTSIFEERVAGFQDRLRHADLDGALITDPDSIYWLSGYWGYASLVSCGRPNIIWVPANDEPEIITPSMELEMCRSLTPFSSVRHWIDGQNGEWKKQLIDIVDRAKPKRLGLDRARTPGIVLSFLLDTVSTIPLEDIAGIIGSMRMIKTAEEVAIMRQAGQVAALPAAASRP